MLTTYPTTVTTQRTPRQTTAQQALVESLYADLMTHMTRTPSKQAMLDALPQMSTARHTH